MDNWEGESANQDEFGRVSGWEKAICGGVNLARRRVGISGMRRRSAETAETIRGCRF